MYKYHCFSNKALYKYKDHGLKRYRKSLYNREARNLGIYNSNTFPHNKYKVEAGVLAYFQPLRTKKYATVLSH